MPGQQQPAQPQPARRVPGKLGKLPPRHDPRTLRLADYLERKALPPPPSTENWSHGITAFGMMGNDRIGDCLLPGTVVTTTGLQQAYRIPYDGPIVSLTTASGKRLSVTANHAVLTTRGFVRARDLREGDHLIGSAFPEAVAQRVRHDFQHAPTRVEDLFKAFGTRAVFRPARMMAPVQFHGDERFFKGQVNIVDSNGLLERRPIATLQQPQRQHGLIERPGQILTLDRERPQLPGVERILRPTSGFVGSGGVRSLLLRRPAVGSNLRSFLPPAELYASSVQPLADGTPTDAHLPSQLIRRCPGLIETDEIRTINHRVWSGHVYDASTDVRWYIANGIVTHNCTFAAVGHAIQIVSANASAETTISDQAIVFGYSAVSGYNPQTGANDNGCVELDVLRYWQQTGVGGHRNVAYAACAVNQPDDVMACIALFGFAYIGFAVPQSAMNQYSRGQGWDVVPNDGGIVGGHAVDVIGYDATGLICVTWGILQRMTWAFWRKYVDEAYGVVTPEWIAANGQSPSGLRLQDLLADVQLLQQPPNPTPTPTPTPVQTTTRLTVSPNPVAVGQAVLAAVTVQDTDGSPLTGQVTITFAGTPFQGALHPDGTASVRATPNGAGTVAVTAHYQGDAGHAPSDATPVTLTITGAPQPSPVDQFWASWGPYGNYVSANKSLQGLENQVAVGAQWVQYLKTHPSSADAARTTTDAPELPAPPQE